MSSLQRAKENNYNQFARLIESMEDRFMNVGADAIVDINSLSVVRTRSGRISKPRVVTPQSRPNTNTNNTKSRRGRKPSSTRESNTRSSIPSIQSTQDSSGFESDLNDTQRSSPSSSPSFDSNTVKVRSILFDRPSQLAATKNLLAIIESGGPLAVQTVSNLYERFKVTLGRDDLPNKATVRPFFTFHEDHDIGVSLLFDSPDFTPWTLICLKFFGEENLGCYQQIYRHVVELATKATSVNNGGQVSRMLTSTPSNRSEYLAVVPIRRNGGAKQVEMDSIDGFNNTHSSVSQSPKKASSNLSSAYTSPTARPIYHPPIDSIVYENDKQLLSLEKLAEILRTNDDESKQVKKKLIARVARALGHDGMPFGQNIYPFFTFHEKGEIGVSFLFNVATLSPWTTIIKLYFGDELITICKDIYRMINCTHIESLNRLEQLAVCYRSPPPTSSSLQTQTSKNLKTTVSTIADRLKKGQQKSSTSSTPSASSKTVSQPPMAFSPVVINNTAPPYRRSIPQSPVSSLSGSMDTSVHEQTRTRMLCRTSGGRRVTRARTSGVLVDINTGNIQPDDLDLDLALTPPAFKKSRRSATSITINKGFSEPSLALAKSRKTARSGRANATFF